jgi:hypothetical protein
MKDKLNKDKLLMLNSLRTKKIGPKLWQLTAPMHFWYKAEMYIIPKGFVTDGASTPRPLWSLCPPMSGRTAEAGVFHDWLYSKDCLLKLTRKEADYLFLIAMRDFKVAMARATAIHMGVRAGGAGSFRKCHSVEKICAATVY